MGFKINHRILIAAVFLIANFGQASAQDSKAVDKAMELSGLSVSESYLVTDFVSLDVNDVYFRKLIHRAKRASTENIDKWSRLSIPASIDTLRTDPIPNRFQVYGGGAVVESLRRFKLPKKTAGFIPSVYVASCRNDQGQPFAVLLREPLRSWPIDQPLPVPQKVTYAGFFLGSFATDDNGYPKLFQSAEEKETPLHEIDLIDEENPPVAPEQCVPVFVAKRLRWFPTETSETPPVSEALVKLSEQGMDVSLLLDRVRPRSNKPIGSSETTALYQMMIAADKVDTMPGNPMDFQQLLRSPQSIGEAVRMSGRIRQCVAAKIDNPQIAAELGTDTWYQVTMFPNQRGQNIVLRNPEGEDLVYQQFPFTFCLPRLPDDRSPQELTGAVFEFSGFFYRMWIYPSERTDQANLAGQSSPLIMVSSVKEIRAAEADLNAFVGTIVGAMLLTIGVVAFFVYRSRSRKVEQEPLPETIDINL